MVCQGSLGVRGRGVPAIISPKPIGTLRKRMGLGNYAPYVGRPLKSHAGICIISALSMVGQVMPITQFLDSSKFDPETNRVMAVAFEMAAQLFSLATKAILSMRESPKELSSMQKPAINPDLLCESALKEFRQHL